MDCGISVAFYLGENLVWKIQYLRLDNFERIDDRLLYENQIPKRYHYQLHLVEQTLGWCKLRLIHLWGESKSNTVSQ